MRTAAHQVVAMRWVLDRALCRIAERRSGVRLAVAADKLPPEFLNLPSEQRFVMRLGPLTWFETWRWIRRNLPGLLRYGDEYLERLWPRLGAELEVWEELERRILEAGADARPIAKIVDEIAPQRPSTGRSPFFDLRRRGERPLRVAIAGPHIANARALALAITRLATEHGVGGRVVAGDEEEKGSLAVLVEVPSPFRDKPQASESDIFEFLKKVAENEPDVVLLDYGYAVPLPLEGSETHERPLLRRLFHRALLIAAGGHVSITSPTGEATAPGVYPEVLAVGPSDSSGHRQPYAEWIPQLPKPDIFMCDQLVGTALEGALSKEALERSSRLLGPGTHGSSFAALHAVGAAILVWSIHPDLAPGDLRALLRRASQQVGTEARDRHRLLTVGAAVEAARLQLVRSILAAGPCSLQSLAAISGLDLRLVGQSLDVLLANNEVRRLTRGRLERYELPRAR
jgi:hypothetical protein